MKKNLVILCLIINVMVTNICYGEDVLKISDYTPKDSTTDTLSLYGYVNGISENSERENGRILLDVSYSKNTTHKNYYGNHSIRLRESDDFRTYKLDDKTYNDSSNSTLFSANSINRFYKNIFFVGLGLNGLSDYQMNKQNISDLNDYKSKKKYISNSIELSIPIEIGVGKIYNIQEAFISDLIVDELITSNLIEKTPTKEQMLTLSDIIIKNRKVLSLNHRQKRREVIKKVFEYLKSENILKRNYESNELEISSITIINDLVNKSFPIEKGQIFYFEYSRIIDAINYSDNQYNSNYIMQIENETHPDVRNNYNNYSLVYKYRNPLTNKLHLGINADCTLKRNEKSGLWKSNETYIDFNGTLAYYINHENLLSLKLTPSSYSLINEIKTRYSGVGLEWSYSLTDNFNIRTNLGLSTYILKEVYKTNKSIHRNLNVSFSYNIY